MNNKNISRRHFLTLTSRGVGLAVVSYGLMGCGNGSSSTSINAPTAAPAPAPAPPVSFAQGVASGDPTQEAVILWTRATPVDSNYSGNVTISWEVATDSEFSNVITNGNADVGPQSDYTLKVDAIGLDANTEYWYRFMSGNAISTMGKAKTLPVGDINSVRLAVMSCSNYPAGFFNVYNLAAQQNVDAVLHLGDYIYEYDRDGYASQNAEALGRVSAPENELLTLADYRARYAQYRSDEDLQLLHASVPFIAVWDDHEVANDAYDGGAENHQPETEGDFEARKLDALQAYFEWMPIRPVVEGDNEIINRSFSFGNLVDLHMLDTRIVGRDQQLDLNSYVDPVTGGFNAEQFTADVSDRSRTLLGIPQRQWLQGSLVSSTGTWQVLGQQVLMGKMLLPAAIATLQLSITDFAELATLAQLAARLQAGDPTLTQEEVDYVIANQDRLTPEVLALLQLPAIPYNLDAWDGYFFERELILGTAKQLGKNLVVLAGDTHNAWANDLRDINGDVVGVEFATASVSSPGLEDFLGISEEAAPATEAGIVQLVSDLQYMNIYNRGLLIMDFAPEKVTGTWLFVNTINSKDFFELPERRMTMESQVGNPGLTEV